MKGLETILYYFQKFKPQTMKSRLKPILYIPCLLLTIMGCSTEETQIYKLENFSTTKKVSDQSFINEVFIITNPPKEEEKLLALIKSFNDGTLIADAEEEKLLSRTRIFYRETRDLNRNFKEKDPNNEGYFAKVDLSGYYEDKVMISGWEVGNGGVNGFYTTYDNGINGNTTHF